MSSPELACTPKRTAVITLRPRAVRCQALPSLGVSASIHAFTTHGIDQRAAASVSRRCADRATRPQECGDVPEPPIIHNNHLPKTRTSILFVRDSGTGSPVLLLHGLLATGDMFGFLAPVLGETYRLLAPDLRGHGRMGPFPAPTTPRRSPPTSRRPSTPSVSTRCMCSGIPMAELRPRHSPVPTQTASGP